MINLPSQNDLKELKDYNENYCVSIYAPFIDPNSATNPNRIELKNLIREAETALLSAGADPKDVKKTLRPARLMLDENEFWPIHHASLALFLHRGFFRYYHVPDHDIPYMLTVEKGFNLEPLQKIMSQNKDYIVLAIGHKNVRLFKGDRYQLEGVHLKDFPTDMKEALNIDEYPKWREKHEIAPSSTGKGSEASHGQYNVSQTDKAMLLEFFRLIDKHLHSYLQHEQKPLILAGVDSLIPIYRQANTSKYLLPGSIKGNQDHAKLDTIRQQAWSLVEPRKPI